MNVDLNALASQIDPEDRGMFVEQVKNFAAVFPKADDDGGGHRVITVDFKAPQRDYPMLLQGGAR